ncbi:hypothetical protein BBJ28_00020097 [Nothophytophthora sp. Chile5]|nr:hypothetical protein BBJ28_00020097 [Nothophytophthora sp. Chile5]
MKIDAEADIILPVPDVDDTEIDAYADSGDAGSEAANEDAHEELSQPAAEGYMSSGMLPPSQYRDDGIQDKRCRCEEEKADLGKRITLERELAQQWHEQMLSLFAVMLK